MKKLLLILLLAAFGFPDLYAGTSPWTPVTPPRTSVRPHAATPRATVVPARHHKKRHRKHPRKHFRRHVFKRAHVTIVR